MQDDNGNVSSLFSSHFQHLFEQLSQSYRNRFFLDNLISELAQSHPIDPASGLIYKKTTTKFIEINQTRRCFV